MKPLANFIFLVVDALRSDSVGFAVPSRASGTPALDRLAREGAAFPDCFTAAVHTPPAFASLLTGCYPPRHGLRTHYQSRLSSDAQPCASALRSAGFATADFFRRTAGSDGSGDYGLDRGIDRHFTFSTTAASTASASALFDWMGAQKRRGRRFFANMVATHAHDYFGPAFRRRFPRDARADRERYQQSLVRGPVARQRAAYAEGVAEFDRALAAWLAEWHRRGLTDDTLLVVTSDHGETLRPANRSHGLTLFDGDLRVPLVFWGRGIPALGVISSSVRTVDVLPTAFELLGLRPGRGDGETLAPALRGRPAADRPAYAELWLPAPVTNDPRDYLKLLRHVTPWPDDLYRQCLRTRGKKVVRDWFKGGYLYYDLSSDPDERRPRRSAADSVERRLERGLIRFAPRKRRELVNPGRRFLLDRLPRRGGKDVLACVGKYY